MTERSTAIDPLLVLRVQLGDREATNELLGVLTPRLCAYLRSIVGPEEVEDLLQEVLLIIYRKIRWLQEPAYVSAWSYRIAGREAFRFIRKKKGARHTQLTAEEWSLVRSQQRTATPEQTLLGQQLIRGVEELPSAGRAVLWLHYLEGLTIEEAAEHLGIAPGTAKSRLSFGLRRLREQLRLARHAGKGTK